MSEESVRPEDLDRLFPHFETVLDFRSSLTPETDRGCALMAAAYLSDQLETLLRATFVDDHTAVDELFRPVGLLGSFSGRTELCFAFGLLSLETRRDLHLVRKIRNDFGHVARALTFDEPTIAARCRELHYSALEADARPRAKFTNAVMGLCAILHGSRETTVRRTIPATVKMTGDLKRDVQLFSEILRAAVSQRSAESDTPTDVTDE